MIATAIAIAIVALQIAAAVGLGAAVLRCLGVLADLKAGERACWAFAVGFGVLGWLIFFLGVAGLLERPVLLAVLVVGAGGVALLGRPLVMPFEGRPGGVNGVLVALLFVVAAFDLAEGLAPPADADSLAYHFALPKRFLAAGGLEFVPRAVDGAVPLLVQMTYVPALGLGGERALTLWTMVSGWGVGALFYTVCRRHLGVAWSLAATLVLLTTPAVLYGAGSGQVETRMALFVAVAAVSVATALRGGLLAYSALAGLMAGFYMGSKYLGVLFVVAAGVVLLAGRGWPRRGLVFAAAVGVAGSQWYAWNWTHTGDPVFPLLFGWVEYGAAGYWDQVHADRLKEVFFGGEMAVPRNPLWLLLYPFRATLMGDAVMESGRTGFGPFVFLLLPFAVAGLWRWRDRMLVSPLAPIAVLVALHYALWFFTGSSQRVRHLLPIYPMLVLCASVAATRWAAALDQKRVLGAAVAATLAVQLAGQTVFSVNYVRHVLTGENREDFLRRSVRLYPIVPWINATLSATRDRILVNDREIVYFIDIPIYLAHPEHQALIDVLPAARDPALFWRQIRDLGITHILYRHSPEGDPEPTLGFDGLTRAIVRGDCAEVVESATVERFASRTLPNLLTATHRVDVLRLRESTCAWR